MKQITSLIDSAKQNLTIVLDSGTNVPFDIRYIASQQGWFYSFTFGEFSATNRRLVVSPNCLRAFRNIIPFGLACLSVDGYEPIYQDDFSSGRISLFVLNEEDVAETEILITETIPNFAGYPLT